MANRNPYDEVPRNLAPYSASKLKVLKGETVPKDAYTFFHRLVFNIKKLIPAGRLGSYAATLLLLREHTNLSEDEII